MNDTDRFNVILSLAAIAVVYSLTAGAVSTQYPEPLPVASAYCSTTARAPELIARAAYAYDTKTNKILIAKNEDAQLPLASLTKLMTVLTALDSMTPGEFVEITDEALQPEGDSGLFAREVWTMQDLIDFSLVSSSNDGIHALALAAAGKRAESIGDFVFRMGEKAKAIGMRETYFLNDTGLDISTSTAGALGSARDIAMLLNEILKTHVDVFQGSSSPRSIFKIGTRTHEVDNTNTFTTRIPQVIASKTGYTDLAGGNLAILFEPIPGHVIAAVVLGSTREGRETDMLALTTEATAALKKDIICHDAGAI